MAEEDLDMDWFYKKAKKIKIKIRKVKLMEYIGFMGWD